MRSRTLRYIRYIFAVFFLGSISLLFLDFRGLVPAEWHRAVTWLQFGPSLVQFIHFAGLLSAGFLFITILTLLFGRLYCSAICPLGILQDVMIRIERWFRKKKIFRYRKPGWWRYVFLGMAILSLVAGFMAVFNLLDPFSNFGRIFSSLGKPLVVTLNNSAAVISEKTGFTIINRYPIRGFDLPTIIFPFLILSLLVFLTWKHGRLFCNFICPVGTFLGLFSRFSLFSISLDKSKCNQCGKCSAKCKAGCINVKTQEIDHSRCVMCFDCLGPCPEKGIAFRLNPFKSSSQVADGEKASGSRRKFISSAVLLGFAGRLAAEDKKGDAFEKQTLIPEKKVNPVSPPGSRSIEQFISTCIACHECVSACPTQVLQPSLMQYGLQGFMQPHMDYHDSFCNFECVICSEVCPTTAIQPITAEEKKRIQLGKAIFLKENCVVSTFNTACGACSEHCPTKAVRMVPYLEGLRIPKVDQSICVGCGACEHACPTKPYKAIFVDGNPIHLTAEIPKEEKIERNVEEEDWAF